MISFLRITAVLAVLGFINAAYVTNLYVSETSSKSVPGYAISTDFAGTQEVKKPALCDINDTFSCSKAVLLENAKIFGLPACTIALFVYPLIFLVGLIGRGKNALKFNMAMGLGGMLMSSYVVYQESTVGVYCLMCILCGLIVTSIFSVSLAGLTRKE